MPLTTTRTLRVRYSDCDAYGHLNAANYLRYMQEAAFDASAVAGYDQKRYDEIQRVWLIRESQVEYLTPVRYDDVVDITTWIGDFKRASSRRLYEFRRSGSDEITTRAFTDWVFLDTCTNRPVAIPPEVVKGFFPEGAPVNFPARRPYPTPPPPPQGVFRMRRRVEWRDIDSMLHVNNTSYMVFASECGFQTVAHFGWPWQRMLGEGFAIYIRRAWLQYLQPALPDDELEISTWIYDLRRATASRHYQIHRVSDKALLAQVNTVGVWVNPETGQPIRIPEKMRKDLEANIARG